jgi:predicted small secreted protein
MLERLIKGQDMKALLILLTLSFSLSACNTIQGMGKDIEKGGEAIQKSTK